MSPLPPFARTSVHLHAACGGLALLSGAVALATRKGSLPHRRAGRVFAVAMVAALVLAQPAILARQNFLLGLLAPFTLYLVLRGVRVARQRDGAAHGFDRALALVAAVGGALLIGRGVLDLARGGSVGGLSTVGLGLGALAL